MRFQPLQSNMKYLKITAALLLASLLGCANLVGNFDQNTYQSATALKVESLALMEHATEPSAAFSGAISALQGKLAAQLAYEEGKGKQNRLSAAQWKLLIDPKEPMLGMFLDQWTVGYSSAFVKEKEIQVGLAFDQILRAEGAKNE